MAMQSYAAYHADVVIPENQQKEAKKAAYHMKLLPKILREACIAEKLGLLHSPSGLEAFASSPSIHHTEKVPYYAVTKTACFVSGDGKLYDYYEVLRKMSKSKKQMDNWRAVKRSIYQLREEVVFSSVEQEVTALCIQTALHHLNQLPRHLRDCLCAELGGLCYMTTGESAVTGKAIVQVRGADISISYDKIKPSAKYIDSAGHEQDYWSKVKERNLNSKIRISWQQVVICASLIGNDEILALCPDTYDAMKKARQERENR